MPAETVRVSHWKAQNGFIEATESHCANCVFAKSLIARAPTKTHRPAEPLYRLATHILCKRLQEDTHATDQMCVMHRLSSCTKFKAL